MKAHGCDKSSVRTIRQSDSSLTYPLELIDVFPDIWKLANSVPVHKNDPQEENVC